MKEYKLIEGFSVADIMGKKERQYGNSACAEYDGDIVWMLTNVFTDIHGYKYFRTMLGQKQCETLFKELPNRPNLTKHLIEWGYIEEVVGETFRYGDYVKFEFMDDVYVCRIINLGNRRAIALQEDCNAVWHDVVTVGSIHEITLEEMYKLTDADKGTIQKVEGY